MKTQWIKKWKRLLVLILTVSMLSNMIDSNLLYVNAANTSGTEEDVNPLAEGMAEVKITVQTAGEEDTTEPVIGANVTLTYVKEGESKATEIDSAQTSDGTDGEAGIANLIVPLPLEGATDATELIAHVEAEEYETYDEIISYSELSSLVAGQSYEVNISLEAKEEEVVETEATVEVTVTTAEETPAPIEDADVKLTYVKDEGDTSETVDISPTTNVGGVATFKVPMDLDITELTLSVEKDGYEPQSIQIPYSELIAGETKEVPVALVEEVPEITETDINVIVTTAEATPAPIKDAKVELTYEKAVDGGTETVNAESTTDDMGAASFKVPADLPIDTQLTFTVETTKYQKSTQEIPYSKLDADNPIEITLTEKASFILTVNGAGLGTVKIGDTNLTADGDLAEKTIYFDNNQTEIEIAPKDNCYYIERLTQTNGGNVTTFVDKTDGEQILKLTNGDEIEVTFAEKSKVNVKVESLTAEGEKVEEETFGEVYFEDDTENKLKADTYYFIPTESYKKICVKPKNNCYYIERLTQTNGESVTSVDKTGDEQTLKLTNGDEIEVTFAEKSKVNVKVESLTAKGEKVEGETFGKVYFADDEGKNLLSGDCYFIPNKEGAAELEISANDDKYYIYEIKINEEKADNSRNKEHKESVKNGYSIKVTFKAKLSKDVLKDLIYEANVNNENKWIDGNVSYYGSNYILNGIEDTDYTLKWSVSPNGKYTAGIENGNNLWFKPYSAQKKIELTVTATFLRNEQEEEVVETSFELHPGEIIINETDCVLSYGDAKKTWINGITVKNDSDGNDFSQYKIVSRGDIISDLTGTIPVGENGEDGKVDLPLSIGYEMEDATLTLIGGADDQIYSVLSNLRIDTKGPDASSMKLSFVTTDNAAYEIIDGTLFEKNEAGKICVAAKDLSGLTKAELYYDSEESPMELVADAKGKVISANIEGDKEYHFTKIILYDVAGNSTEISAEENDIDYSLHIDTVKPEKPSINSENKCVENWYTSNDGNAPITFVIKSASTDVVKFEYCSKEANWSTVESLDATLSSANETTAEWKFEDDWVDCTYLVRAVDKLGNLSEELEYTVKIDNVAPTVGEIAFFDAKGKEFTNTDEIQTDSDLTVKVPVTDENGVGLAADKPVQLSYKTVGAGEVSVEMTEKVGGGEYSYTLEVPKDKFQKFTNLKVTVKDKLDNEYTKDAISSVEIDKKAPTIDVEWNGTGQGEYWFSENDENAGDFEFNVTVTDDTKIDSVELYYKNPDSFSDDELVTEIKENVNSEVKWELNLAQVVHNLVVNECTDKNLAFYVVAWDQFGTEYKTADIQIRIDETFPQVESTGSDDIGNAISFNFKNVSCGESAKPVNYAGIDKEKIEGILVSGEEVVLTIPVSDPTQNDIASGLKEVEVKVNGESTTYPLKDETEVIHIFKAVADAETEYVLDSILVRDNAGNEKIYTYGLTIVVDKKDPTATFVVDNYSYISKDGLTGWANKDLTLQATATDDYGISSLQWGIGENEDNFVSLDDSSELNGKKFGDFACDRTFTDEQSQLYTVKITDWAGNVAYINKGDADGCNISSLIQIDKHAPVDDVRFTWTGDLDENGNKLAEVGKDVYNRTWVKLNVYVRDAQEEGIAYSDIEHIEVTPNLNGKTGATISKYYPEPSSKIATINGVEYIEYSTLINWTNKKEAEIQNCIDEVVLYDNAENKTVATANELKDGVSYILDNVAPELTVDYHKGDYVENGQFPNTYFYKKDTGIGVTIRERNFFKDDVKVTLANAEMTQSDWSSTGENSNKNSNSVFSTAGEGLYQFYLEYADPSTNKMTGVEVNKKGEYTSKAIVVDATAPKIDITYECGGSNITGEIQSGKFYPGTVTATVRITEKYFDPNKVMIKAFGSSSESNSGIEPAWANQEWKQEGDTWINTVVFDKQGTYGFTCSCVDAVGNEAEIPAQSLFAIDTTAPKVEIIYDLNEPLNGKYYKEERTATIRVTDRSFDPNQIDIIMQNTEAEPKIGEWTHAAAGGCGNEDLYHVDNCVHECKVVYAEDGDYSLGFKCTDKAGNQSETVTTEEFTVDKTLPEIVVDYDNDDVRNDKYYNSQRIGTIQITEHNFDPEGVSATVHAQTGGSAVNAPSVSAWRTEGDTHTATITYDYDAEFSFDIAYVDLAGNEAEDYAGDEFVVDMTAPMLEITDIEDRSANNATVAPGITYSDINLDRNGVVLNLNGVNNGDVIVETSETAIAGGLKIQYQDFPREKKMDDLYTFHAVVEDLAGNVSEQSVMFSVNRFGSVYILDEETQAIVDKYYINKPAHLNVTEINVDTLEFKEITYSKGGDIVTMKAGTDYTVSESGSESTWKAYTYDISEDNFLEESAYTVTIYSEDRATNKSNNIVKEKSIEFVMDTTAPTVVVTGVEDKEQYNENSRMVTIDATDNIYLAGVTAYLNNKPIETFDAEVLAENGGVVTMEIGSSNEWQTLYVKAFDAAGNEYDTDVRSFLITKNIFVQWYRNAPLFWGTIGGMAALIAAILFFLFYKKEKKEDKEAAA